MNIYTFIYKAHHKFTCKLCIFVSLGLKNYSIPTVKTFPMSLKYLNLIAKLRNAEHLPAIEGIVLLYQKKYFPNINPHDFLITDMKKNRGTA